MDCVSPAGDAVLAYCADLRWRGVKISYESALEMRGGGPAVVSSSLKPHGPPVADGPRIRWQSCALGLEAIWTGAAPREPAPATNDLAIHRTIYDSPGGSVEWSCLLSSAEACVRTTAGPIAGHGYVERLTLTIAPWRLPISSLRWGRIATHDDAIVWIQWLGDFNTTIVYANGGSLDAEHLDDGRLALADGTTIEFDRQAVLRSGALGTTVLPSIPVLRDLAPLRLLGIRECKWLSRAAITSPGRASRRAWAIHELVTWPRKGPRRHTDDLPQR